MNIALLLRQRARRDWLQVLLWVVLWWVRPWGPALLEQL